MFLILSKVLEYTFHETDNQIIVIDKKKRLTKFIESVITKSNDIVAYLISRSDIFISRYF